MKAACPLTVALLIVSAVATSPSSVRAQDSLTRTNTSLLSTNVDTSAALTTPCYLIQVQYIVVQRTYTRWGYGYRHYYTWVTVAETEDQAEAMFIYELYKLAEEQDVLDEVAPVYPNAYPLSVRLIIEDRPLELSAW